MMLRKRSVIRSERGAALVELAVVLPTLALVLVGTVDFARLFYMSIELTNAARAGAQYAAFNEAKAKDTTGITNATIGAAPNIAPITVLLNTPQPPVCRCAADNGSSFSIVDCTTGTCSSGQHLMETVTVTVSKPFSTLVPYPGIPRPVALSRTSTMRVVF